MFKNLKSDLLVIGLVSVLALCTYFVGVEDGARKGYKAAEDKSNPVIAALKKVINDERETTRLKFARIEAASTAVADATDKATAVRVETQIKYITKYRENPTSTKVALDVDAVDAINELIKLQPE